MSVFLLTRIRKPHEFCLRIPGHKIGRKTNEGKHFLTVGVVLTAFLAAFLAVLGLQSAAGVFPGGQLCGLMQRLAEL